MDLEYTGPVLSKAGKMFACVHYEPVTYGQANIGGNINNVANSNVNRLSNAISLIKNGLYN